MDKKQLRKALREKRRSISREKKIIYDRQISKQIIEADYFAAASQVLVFASSPEEFDTSLIIGRCRQDGKDVFYPLCTDSVGNMSFYRCDSDEDLHTGMYGIPEPEEHCPRYTQKKNDIVIVPCLSADKQGYRIGYGKGYYDRFLKDFNGVSICPCYEELLTDTLPTDENDIKVKIIVTQNSVKEEH